MTETNINSRAYWDQRFAENWESAGGIAQSRFFARLALEALPGWVRFVQKSEGMTICDWGCAEGDGTDVLASLFGTDKITGVDFSAVAIEKALTRYPYLQFHAADWLDDTHETNRYDIVFSSNTLEHFHNPYSVLDKISRHAGKILILALPYREYDRIEEHHYTFLPENIPAYLGQSWSLAFSKVIDCRRLSPNYWPGEQVVLIFTKREWAACLHLTLSDIKIADCVDIQAEIIADLNQATNEHKTQITDLHQKISEREAQITTINEILAEREQQIAARDQMIHEREVRISELLNSSSWRITAPLRAVVNILPTGPAHLIRRSSYLLQRYRHGVLRHGFLRSIPLGLRTSYTLTSAWLKKQTRHREYEQRLRSLASIIINHHGFIDIFHVPMGWSTPLFQRFQHMSLQAANLGGLALYGGHTQIDRDMFVFEHMQGNVLIFDALDERVVQCVFNALRQSSQKKILRLQSIDLVTHIEDIERFINDGITVIYEYIDEINEEITGAIPAFVKERHESLLRDERVLAVATADKLLEEIKQYRLNNYLLSTNGVDLKHWRQTSKVPPADMAPVLNSGRTIVGYHGALAKWIDYELLRKIAEQGSYELVLIGYEHDTSLSDSGLVQHPNVHFLGSKSYFILNEYTAFYDIGILPFQRYALTESVSPVKLFEYMAAGKPIVTTDLRECSKYASCLVSSSHEMFLQNLQIASSAKFDENYKKALAKDAEHNSWSEKASLVFHQAGVSISGKNTATVDLST